MLRTGIQKTTKIALAVGIGVLVSSPAFAFPDKPVELVVTFKPGGGSDVSARVFTKCLANHFSEKVLVKNVAGARGKIGEVEVRDARPDGYTLLWAHHGMDMAKPTGRSDYNYSAFQPVASVLKMNYGIFAGEKSGIQDVASLRKMAKENAGKYTIGMALNGFSHFAALDFLDAAGIGSDQVRTIPMSGDKNRIVAAIQGNLTLVPTAVGAAAPYVDSGDLNSIAVLSKDRDLRLADAPTAAEQGVNSMFAQYFTTFAPKGTPKDVVKILADAWAAAAKDPACGKELAKQSMVPDVVVGAELDKVMAQRVARIESLAKKFSLTSK
jgi:tripartite-type tricarboxylate transporter receptor subunit TctC